MKLPLLSGFAMGVIATLGTLQFTDMVPSVGAKRTSVPPGLVGTRGENAKIDAIDVNLGDWQAWFVHTPNGFRQMLFSVPGQPGVVAGELYDSQGRPLGQGLARQHERSLTDIESIELGANWLSADFEYSPSPIELQSRRLAGDPLLTGSTPTYLMVDPFDRLTREQAVEISALLEKSQVRVIPVPNAGPDSFDGLHAIMEVAHLEGDHPTSLDVFRRALTGETVLPVSQPGDAAHERSFMDFSKNVSLQTRLGIEHLPVVIEQTAEGGIEVTSLRNWSRASNHTSTNS